MRRTLAVFIASAVCAGGLLAQLMTPGIEIDRVSHEPSASEVGGYIAGLQEPHPDAGTPGVPAGATIGVYGNGNGLHHLPGETGFFYALANTTTHALVYIRNTTGATISIPPPGAPGGLEIASTEPKVQPDGVIVPQFPDPLALSNTAATYPNGPLIHASDATIDIPSGPAVSVFLLRIKWAMMLMTSPREYYIYFAFLNGGAGAPMGFRGEVRVPRPEDRENGCTATSNDRLPYGLALLGVSAAAIVTRRKLLGRS